MTPDDIKQLAWNQQTARAAARLLAYRARTLLADAGRILEAAGDESGAAAARAAVGAVTEVRAVIAEGDGQPFERS